MCFCGFARTCGLMLVMCSSTFNGAHFHLFVPYPQLPPSHLSPSAAFPRTSPLLMPCTRSPLADPEAAFGGITGNPHVIHSASGMPTSARPGSSSHKTSSTVIGVMGGKALSQLSPEEQQQIAFKYVAASSDHQVCTTQYSRALGDLIKDARKMYLVMSKMMLAMQATYRLHMWSSQLLAALPKHKH